MEPGAGTHSTTRGKTWIALGALALALGAGGYAFRLAWTSGGATPEHAAGAPTKGSAAPATASAIMQSAQSYMRQGEVEKAETILAEASRQYATDQALHVAYADVLMSRGKVAEAYAQYEQALAIGPREGTLEFTAGTAANMAGMSERAVEHYSAAQTADKTNPKYPLYLGQVQLKLGQADEAKASILRAALLDPEQAIAWGTLADVALRENNLDLALQHIAKARKLEPGVATWRLIECRALTRQGQPEKGVQLLITLGDSEKFSGPVLKQIGECYGMLKKPGDAAAVYTKASDAHPEDGALAREAADWAKRASDANAEARLDERARRLGK